MLSKLGLKPGGVFLDVGCGDGFFAIPAAIEVGPKGLVYGVDASPEALDSLKSHAANEGLSNIRLLFADATEAEICRACVDVALMANVLHDFNYPLKVLSQVRTALKPGGMLAVLDWKKSPMLHGPSPAKRLDVSQATDLIQKAGFEVTNVGESGRFHYFILAVSPVVATA